jgi:hypothetical protein
MCRKPIHFKGFAKVREQWDADARETRIAEVIDEAMTGAIEEAFEFCAEVKSRSLRKLVMDSLLEDLSDIEKTARFLQWYDVSPEELEYWLMETDEYFSDRSIGRCKFEDEPVKDLASRYPRIEKANKAGKRCRARQDQWFTVSFVFNMV